VSDEAKPEESPPPKKRRGNPNWVKGMKQRGGNPTGIGPRKNYKENLLKGNPALKLPEYHQYRNDLQNQTRKNLGPIRIAKLLEKLYKHAMSEDEGWQRSAEMVLERAMGKPKVDVEVDVKTNSTYEVRLMAAMVAGRLAQAVAENPDELDVVDGTVAGAITGCDQAHRVEIPSLPAPIHLRPDEVPGEQQGGSDWDHLRPVVQVVQEAGVPAPGPAEDERTVRVQEPDGGE
jgi:hypothetical protein